MRLGCFHVWQLKITLLWTLRGMYLFTLAGFLIYFLDKYPGMELLGHMVLLVLVFWENSSLFYIVDIPVYFPTSNIQGFPFVHILLTRCLHPFVASHPDRCEIISLWFWVAFPWWLVMLSIFSCAVCLTICISSLEKCIFRSSALFFKTVLFVFLVLSRINCLYMLDINRYWVMSFENIFSYSAGCVLIFSMVSFGIQNV